MRGGDEGGLKGEGEGEGEGKGKGGLRGCQSQKFNQ